MGGAGCDLKRGAFIGCLPAAPYCRLHPGGASLLGKSGRLPAGTGLWENVGSEKSWGWADGTYSARGR